MISIHTFLAEGDVRYSFKARSLHPFQSTPSSRKVTAYNNSQRENGNRFQSTPSSRKVTLLCKLCCTSGKFQSTPSSRKVTHITTLSKKVKKISIHTFLAEGDCKNIYNYFFIMHIFMHYILSYL